MTRSPLLPLALLLCCIACESPTSDLPGVDSVVHVAAGEGTVDVTEFLPPTMHTAGDAFTLELPTATVTRTLAQLCSPCSFSSQPVPWPSSNLAFGTQMDFP